LSANGTSDLIFITSKWNAKTYNTEIIKKHLIKTGRSLIGSDFIVYQDNDTSHLRSHKLLEDWNVSRIPVPADSCDLNVIENAWSWLKARLYKIPFSSVEKLKKDARKIWKRLPISICEALVTSMSRRLTTVINRNGMNTKYG